MFATPSLIAATATLLFSQSLAAAIPDTSVNIVPRGGGIPASNGPGMTCYNSWETVTNDVSMNLIDKAPQCHARD